MINAIELRLGNEVLFKSGHAIKKASLQLAHFEVIAASGVKDFYPIVLKPEIFIDCGFVENKDYPLAPGAKEFILALPVIGNNKNEIIGYSKTNGECFARATVNGLVISNNIFNLHNLQNLYFALTGKEMHIKI